MNWDYSGTKSYVDVIPPVPIYNPNLAYERSPIWPYHQADARLKPNVLRQPCSSEQPGQSVPQFVTHGHVQAQHNAVPLTQRVSHLQTTSLPPVEPSKQLASTPDLTQGGFSPKSSQSTPALHQSTFSPPHTGTNPSHSIQAQSSTTNMADPNRGHGQQRPLMGPPETPSRVMQASPSMFPTLQFSPDLFSTQSMGPATAPAYPQQRLFWDQQSSHPDHTPIDQYHNPYQDHFDASFHSSSTIVPNYSPVVSQENGFDLPQQSLPPGPFLDTTAFPMPFQTSPRPPPPSIENPAQFLSSPARRFGGTDIPTTAAFGRPSRDLPAYHHQIEESRREREVERRKNKHAAKRADAELIMSSVRRALSPSKSLRPGLKRSQTHSGLSVQQQQHLRKSSRNSGNDSASVSSIASAESSRTGRSSPLKSMRQTSSSSLSKLRLSQKARTAMSLAIDENGVAKTVLQKLPESDDEMDVDDDNDSQSVISSADEGDFHILSQTNSFSMDDMNIPTRKVEADRSSVGLRPRPDGRGMSTMSNMRAGKGDAQKALRAIIEDRSRSVSAQGGYSSSRQSDSSVQFHSSPPVQQNQFGDFNASPTTITDPDLATPSTDHEGYANLGATRCVCNSISLDGSAMIQCDSCSKWLHAACIGIDKHRASDVYICVYCDSTPVRHPANRGSARSSIRTSGNSASPLAHKSVHSSRGR